MDSWQEEIYVARENLGALPSSDAISLELAGLKAAYQRLPQPPTLLVDAAQSTIADLVNSIQQVTRLPHSFTTPPVSAHCLISP
jgi:hypothetical protein